VPLGDQHATGHNPGTYFHSIIVSSDCAKNVVNLSNQTSDLKSIDTTTNLNLITPNTRDDGHAAPCVNGQPGGLVSADAIQKDGLLIIHFDESSYATVTAPSATEGNLIFAGATCCSRPPGPNLRSFPQTSSLTYKGVTMNRPSSATAAIRPARS
jgi:hypothetical protein